MSKQIEIIWKDFGEKLRSFVVSRVRDESVADDILQEVFLRIHSGINTLRDETRIRPWIYQITRNLIADYFRSVKRGLSGSVQDSSYDEDPPGDFMPESIQDMINMMDNLPKEYCDALCMTEFEGMSQAEYAEKAGISYSGAKSRVQRARKMLRDMLMNCCHYQFDKYGTVIDILPAHCCCCSDNRR